jgi:hypothetical protein
MRIRSFAPVIAAALATLGITAVAVPGAHAESTGSVSFEAPYTVGDINGQHGWSKTGGFDVAVATVADFANASGFGFGSQALRLSDAVTSGSFGDQTFSPTLTESAGESAIGDLPHLHAAFQIGSTQAIEQSGLHLSVSPDQGDGARVSYLRFEDQSDGIHVFFDDVTNAGPLGAEATFNESEIATIDRTSAHLVAFDIIFLDGPGNDVVTISIDGSVVKTGTTWEDYYRFDAEQTGNGNVVPHVSTLLFRESGSANPGNAGNGFLVDGVTVSSTPMPCTFTMVDSTTEQLDRDCVTDHTIVVPDGFTLDGNGHTVTAVDPSGSHFVGGVIESAGATANVRNVTVEASGLVNVCDSGADRLRGIYFDGAAGSIANNRVIGINQGLSGCQEGNAIEVRNAPFDNTHPATKAVAITGNVVRDYQKTGIVTNGDLSAQINGNDVGAALADLDAHIAANSIQVAFGATASVGNNIIAGNDFDGAGAYGTAVLVFQANNVTIHHNTITGAGTDIGIDAEESGTVNVNSNSIRRTADESGPDEYGIGVNFEGNGRKSQVSKNTFKGWNVNFQGQTQEQGNTVLAP